jgi:hypothetical protein
MADAAAPRGQGGLPAAVILPACDEAESIPFVLRELAAVLGPSRAVFVVGVNGSSDGTADAAAAGGALVAQTDRRGYGHGCLAAIALARALDPAPWAYAFAAADGATDPGDVARVLDRLEQGYDLVLGERTSTAANARVVGGGRSAGNRLLGAWVGVLTGRFFRDIGPVRAIRRGLLERIDPREPHLGWTIEMQVRAVMLGARVCEIPAVERPRIAGVQKVSSGGIGRRLGVGLAIGRAGWSARFGDRSAGSSKSPRS